MKLIKEAERYLNQTSEKTTNPPRNPAESVLPPLTTRLPPNPTINNYNKPILYARHIAYYKRNIYTNDQQPPQTQPIRLNLSTVHVRSELDKSNAIKGKPKNDSTQWNYSRVHISNDVNPQSYAHAYPLILLHLTTELIISAELVYR